MDQDAIVIGAATYTVTRSFAGQQTRETLLTDLIRKKLEPDRFIDARNADAV